MTAKALLIAAPSSGTGKTTLTAGLLAAFKRGGIRVGAAKCGPDYIDPGFLAAASGSPCFNLDGWAMPPSMLDAVAAEAARDADLLLIEGAMGLFDGVPGASLGTGAAAELALRFALPVLLILDVSGQAQSAAAVLHGFASLDPRLRIAGVVPNRVGSPRHADSIREAIAPLGIPVAGVIPRTKEIGLPERHLGLVQAGEHADIEARLGKLADLVARHCDLGLIGSLAAPLQLDATAERAVRPPGQRIALAQDASFSFIYPHLLAGWRASGSEIVTFSPLADEAPPDDCDCCWLPGGYPELFASTLAQASRFKQGLHRFAEGRPVHGECGGYMVLGEGLEDANGQRHAMTGLLSHSTSFAQRRLHLGYRSAHLLSDCSLGKAGDVFRGHEFHYATTLDAGADAPLVLAEDARGTDLGAVGGRRGQITGSFFHLIADTKQTCTASIPHHAPLR
jgi:cobyrinic acid a,c-diamide synthase